MSAKSRRRANHEHCDDRIAQLERRLDEALKRVADLEAGQGRNSQNSDQPPSADSPNLPRRKKARTGRKPGGQPGHVASQRALVEPNRIISVRPTACWNCEHPLTGTDSHPLRHQVTEIPRVEPDVTEYQLHTLCCSRCRYETLADLPPGVPPGQFGPRLTATVGYLCGAFRLSKRLVQDLVSNLLGVEISLGSVIACQEAASLSLAAPVDAAKEYVKQQSIKHADESSWLEGARRTKVWLWTVTTTLVTVFLIRSSRGTKVAREALGQDLGILVTDRWCAYSWWPLERRQLCWAHIKRHFQAFAEADSDAAQIGRALLRQEKRLFRLWHRVRDGTLMRSTFRTYVSAIRQRMHARLVRGSRCEHAKTATTCSELLKLEPAMWTFVRVAGVEPTNNAGERAIRPGVIWRKLCFGTHSQAGSRFVERMLSVVYSLKQQNRNALDFVTECVNARLKGHPPATLLPQSA